jgi:thiol-disulfide isomerase/thioredoxin
MPDVGRWQHSDAFTTAVISRGDIEANRAKAVEHGVSPMLVQAQREVAHAYGAAVTPCAVVVDADGYIASEVARGPVDIRALAATLEAKVARPAAPEPMPTPRGLPIGTPAPPIHLEDLDGNAVEVGGGDRPTLVLFWDPGCGFCKKMLADLQAWEADPPSTAPDLVVISTGDIDANRAQGLRAPVLLAPRDVMTSFRASGTPMAALIDTDGLIASSLAVGSGEVMSLLAGTASQIAQG